MALHRFAWKDVLIAHAQVNETILKKVMEWCEHHVNDAPTAADDDTDTRKKTTEIDDWDQKFMNVDQEMLFEIILVSTPRFINISLSV